MMRVGPRGERDADANETERDGEEDVLHASNRTLLVQPAASAR